MFMMGYLQLQDLHSQTLFVNHAIKYSIETLQGMLTLVLGRQSTP